MRCTCNLVFKVKVLRIVAYDFRPFRRRISFMLYAHVALGPKCPTIGPKYTICTYILYTYLLFTISDLSCCVEFGLCFYSYCAQQSHIPLNQMRQRNNVRNRKPSVRAVKTSREIWQALAFRDCQTNMHYFIILYIPQSALHIQNKFINSIGRDMYISETTRRNHTRNGPENGRSVYRYGIWKRHMRVRVFLSPHRE